jgi:predicted nucleic acid-binding protein
MTVYVESNFVLEIAFEQEQVADCTGIIELAESRQVSLVVPAFCIGECIGRIRGRKDRRTVIRDSLREEIKQLGRSVNSISLSDQLRALTDLLVAGAEADEQRYDTVLRRLLSCAEIIPLDATVIHDSLAARQTYDLSPQDAIVLTCVLSHLATAKPPKSVLITRDKHFHINPDIRSSLEQLGCVLKPEFRAGLAYLKAELGRTA